MSTDQRFKVTVFTDPSGQQVWRVQGRLPNGQRIRLNYRTQAEAVAQKALLEIRALNQPGLAFRQTRLTDSELAQAEAAFVKLDGKPLLPAIEFFLTHGCPRTVNVLERNLDLRCARHHLTTGAPLMVWRKHRAGASR